MAPSRAASGSAGPDQSIGSASSMDHIVRDQPVQFMNYRRPLVQESRAAVAESNAAHAAAGQAAAARMAAGGFGAPEGSVDADKIQTFMESKANGTFVKLTREQMHDLESQQANVDTIVDDLPTLGGQDEAQTANLKLQQVTTNVFLFIHGCLAGFAILHLYLVYHKTSDMQFLSYYATMAREVSITYYGISMIAVVSALSRFLLRYDNSKFWADAPFLVRLRIWLFMFVYLVLFVCLLIDDEVEGRFYFETTNNAAWFQDAALVAKIATVLQYCYSLSAIRFVMCVIGGVLAVLEFEVPLTVAEVDFATPKDRFV